MKNRSWQALILVVLLLLGLFFVYIHDAVITPPGVVADKIYDLSDALRVSQGYPLPLGMLGFRAAATGRGDDPEMAYRYLLGFWYVFTGASVFSAQFFESLLNLLTVALAYQAAWMILDNLIEPSWRQVCSLLAAAIAGSSMLFVFISHLPDRLVLVSPVVLLALIMFLKASRSQKGRYWLLGGFFAGLGVHTYTAAIVTPVWAGAFLLHQAIIAPKRISWKNFLRAVVGMLIPLAVLMLLILYLPELYFRVGSISPTHRTVISTLQSLWSSVQEYFVRGDSDVWGVNDNAPYLPMFMPIVSIFIVLGIVAALRRWRSAESVLLLGGIVLFTLPATLSGEPKTTIRMIGAIYLLGLLGGWGASFVFSLRPLRSISLLKAAVVLLIVALIATSYSTWQNLFAQPSVYGDLGVERNFNTVYVDSMKWLAQVNQPTYVPLWILDNPIAAFFMERQATVTTWARYPLKEYPAGQFFFPSHSYSVTLVQDDSTLRALYLPAEKVIVILPPNDLPPAIAARVPLPGDPGTTEIETSTGEALGQVKSVPRADFVSLPPPQADAAPLIGNGLRLLTRQPPVNLAPGKLVRVTLEWLVTGPQPADDFSVVQLLDSDFHAVPGFSDQAVLPFIYPSAYWKPGDIIPDEHRFYSPGDMKGVYRLGAGMYVLPNPRMIVSPPDLFSDPQLKDMWVWDAKRFPDSAPNQSLPADAVHVNATLNQKISLGGYKLAHDGNLWTVTLYWRPLAKSSGDYIIFVHAERDGKVIAQTDKPPFEGTDPTSAWTPGDLIATSLDVQLPDTGTANFFVGMYDYPSLQRLPVIQNGAVRDDNRVKISLDAAF